MLALVLTSCGSDNSSDGADPDGQEGLKAATITGAVGKAIDVEWKSPMTSEDLVTDVLETGDGPEVQAGDQVLVHIWIGNGFTQEKSFSTYDQGKPEAVTVDDNLSPVFADAIKGQTIGSRVAVTAPADQAFGESGNPDLGIANKDTVLVVMDLIEINVVLDGPSGADKPAPSWAPELVQKGGAVTTLDFKNAPKPNGKLRSATLVKGDGDVVEKGQTITVNYLGQVYGGKQPFDESYSKGSPASFGIGAGQVIPGWDKTLVGATVGSRLLLAIPPKDGYGDQGNKDAGIKGTDTLYFVVDILGAS